MDELSTYDPFATAAEYAAYARRSLSAEDTATADQNLAAASAEIRRHCEWQIWPQLVDDTLILDTIGGRLLVLPVSHVVAIASIHDDGMLLEETAYEWSRNGVIERGCWSRKRRAAEVVLTHGFATRPNDLKLLACQLAGRAESAGRGPVNSERAGNVQVSYAIPQTAVMPAVELTAADQRRLSGYLGGYR